MKQIIEINTQDPEEEEVKIQTESSHRFQTEFGLIS